MKNGTFWYIQMLQIVLLSAVCPYNLPICIQHPQKGMRSSNACLTPKNSVFDQKTTILGRFFHEKWHFLDAYSCCKLWFSDLCAPTTCFFTSSSLQIGGGSPKACLRPESSIFDKKRPFLAVLIKNVCRKLCFGAPCLPRTCCFASSTLKIEQGVFNCLPETCFFASCTLKVREGSSTAWLKAKKIQFLTKKLLFLADFGRKRVFNRLAEAKTLNV